MTDFDTSASAGQPINPLYGSDRFVGPALGATTAVPIRFHGLPTHSFNTTTIANRYWI
jgi:hypothetical protein